MSNHQIYTDWAYIWSLLYLAEIPNSIIIILKDSLRWAPIVGPAMQLFRFVVRLSVTNLASGYVMMSTYSFSLALGSQIRKFSARH